PLKPQSYEYVYKHIKSSVLLGSISGTRQPCARLGRYKQGGLDLNQVGEPVWGESGELVCTKPMPCQPTHFWNDENGNKYRKAYFSRFSGMWHLGFLIYNIALFKQFTESASCLQQSGSSVYPPWNDGRLSQP
uniref:Uncharacterized protein n=1 Tax=Naja naja TaxID=35670 RepID=A0A8C6YAZ7_NAJNA